jgi:hypothetical protein
MGRGGLWSLLRVFRPEAGEEIHQNFFDMLKATRPKVGRIHLSSVGVLMHLRFRRSAETSLLIARVLTNPANPEAQEKMEASI